MAYVRLSDCRRSLPDRCLLLTAVHHSIRSQDDENFANTYAEKDTLTDIVKPRQSTENAPQFGICIDTAENEIGTLLLDEKAEDWKKVTVQIEIPDGVHALYLVYKGQAKVQLIEIHF